MAVRRRLFSASSSRVLFLFMKMPCVALDTSETNLVTMSAIMVFLRRLCLAIFIASNALRLFLALQHHSLHIYLRRHLLRLGLRIIPIVFRHLLGQLLTPTIGKFVSARTTAACNHPAQVVGPQSCNAPLLRVFPSQQSSTFSRTATLGARPLARPLASCAVGIESRSPRALDRHFPDVSGRSSPGPSVSERF